MKQVVQNYNSGELRLEDVPAPVCKSGGLVVRAAYSLLSTGTERMKVSQARMNFVQMAKNRPDKVKQVVQSVKQVGLLETFHKVRERLDTLTPLGYSLAGIVVEVGGGIDEFAIGDRVACAGEGLACHAEFVSVPKNLCVHVPDNVELRDAAFATVGSIAMNGVRQAGVTVGDSVLVIGLGLVGLLGVQILKASGCQVIGVDLDPSKVELAKRCGADLAMTRDHDGLKDAICRTTDGLGADVAYIAASANSTDPMTLAGDVLRDRGTVVIVGQIPVEADWRVYYRKELSVVMSRSYGPGRYDRNYEDRGIDYPVGYVRWTERRNLREFLRLIDAGKIDTDLLLPRIAKFDEAPQVYQELYDSPVGQAPAILFEYAVNPLFQPGETRFTLHARSRSPVRAECRTDSAPLRKVMLSEGPANDPRELKLAARMAGRVGVGMIGAGNFATATLVPALKNHPNVDLRAVCSARGLSAKSTARRHGFAYCTSDYHEILKDQNIQAVIIATRHDTHARFAAECARAGKHVFVEKPLALTEKQLAEVIEARQESGRIIMPGYNRRFSPLSIAVRDTFAKRSGPVEVVCRINAGAISADSWYQDPEEGGWRIISEGCHFVDLIQFICGCPPIRVFAECVGGSIPGAQNDNCCVMLKMADGSIGTLIYVANGDPQYEKERIEVFGAGRTALIQNFRIAKLIQSGKSRTVRPRGSGKGHGHEIAAFIDAVSSTSDPSRDRKGAVLPTSDPSRDRKGAVLPTSDPSRDRKGAVLPTSDPSRDRKGAVLPTFEEAVRCTRATFAAARSMAEGKAIDCDINA